MLNYIILKIKYLILFCLFLCIFGGNVYASSVMVDQGHGQVFLIENNGPLDLSSLAKLFKAQGLEVKVNSKKFYDTSFAGVDSLVISGPFLPITSSEVNSVLSFIQEGSRLCLMLHIPSPVTPLLTKLSIAVSVSPINERENILAGNTKNFSIRSLQPHPVTEGLASFKVYGTWGIMNTKDNSRVIASASPQSWIDTNKNTDLDDGDAVSPHGVLVAGDLGKGSFIVFGDDAIFQNQFITEENMQMGINLARWLQAK